MTIIMNMQEAKANLSRLVAEAEKGDEVFIANRNVPRVRLTVVDSPAKRRLGFVAGEEHWDDAFFDAMSEEDLQLWGG
jgi:prevent-host-death family protein